MAYPSPQRTIRRCVAVLVIPVSLYPMVFMASLETNGYPYMNTVLELADEIALLMLLGSVGYLVGSICLQIWQSQPDPPANDLLDAVAA